MKILKKNRNFIKFKLFVFKLIFFWKKNLAGFCGKFFQIQFNFQFNFNFWKILRVFAGFCGNSLTLNSKLCYQKKWEFFFCGFLRVFAESFFKYSLISSLILIFGKSCGFLRVFAGE
jgi:hypothetical protein